MILSEQHPPQSQAGAVLLLIEGETGPSAVLNLLYAFMDRGDGGLKLILVSASRDSSQLAVELIALLAEGGVAECRCADQLKKKARSSAVNFILVAMHKMYMIRSLNARALSFYVL